MHEHATHRVVACGIDTLRVNAIGRLAWQVRDQLDAVQARALEERNATRGRRRAGVLVETPWRLAGQPLLIRPHGGGNAQWRWIVTCPYAAFELGLGELNGVCCRVRLGADFLWRFGYRAAWAKVRALLDTWGEDGMVEEGEDDGPRVPPRYQVSELHLCADIAGMAIDQLQREAFVHRGTITNWHIDDAQLVELVPRVDDVATPRPVVDLHIRHGETEGLTFSKTGAHACAIYNKPREIRYKSRDKVWFADIWRHNGWDGAAPIARVEMRYRRAALHELGCEDVEATFDRLDALWAYSTREWLRHTVPEVRQDTNRSRWPVSLWWLAVQSADFGRPQTAPAQRQRAHAVQEDHILATIYGYLESWAAYTAGRQVPADLDLSTVLRAVADRSHSFYSARHSDFYQEVLRRRKRIGFPR